jgi:hypothetical protein
VDSSNYLCTLLLEPSFFSGDFSGCHVENGRKKNLFDLCSICHYSLLLPALFSEQVTRTPLKIMYHRQVYMLMVYIVYTHSYEICVIGGYIYGSIDNQCHLMMGLCLEKYVRLFCNCENMTKCMFQLIRPQGR